MRARGLVLAMSICAATLCGGLLAATPALAALETPEEEKASAVTATTATLEGVLNPKATSMVEGGQYEFLYNYSPTECENVFASPQSTALGNPKEKVSTNVTELQPSLKYTFCLVEKNGASEVVKGVPVTFETEAAPPTIINESVEAKATEATLNATINPNNQEATYAFEYSTKATGEVLEGSIVKFNGASPLAGFNEEPVSAATGAVLTQDTTYYYRVSSKNAKGEESAGKVEHFTTPTPEAPETKPATAITSSSADLNGVLNPKHPGEAGTYQFRYQQSPTECHEGASTPIPEPAEAALGNEKEATKPIEVSGLLPGATYTFCLVAQTPSGEAIGPPVTFTTLATGVTVGEESFTKVGSSSAELHAKIDPGGAQTSYFFEYGTTEAYSSATPITSAGTASAPISVSTTLEDLQPETTYYFRVVASNTAGPQSGGKGDSFSTFPVSPLGLPDGRSYELVSPPNNGDATALLSPGQPTRSAADGNAVTYAGTAPPAGGNGTGGAGAEGRPDGTNMYLARRLPSGGWTAVDIQPNGLDTAIYQGFSDDLSVGILGSQQGTEGGPSGEGPGGLYSRNDSDGRYRLLGTSTRYAGSTPDGSNILFSSGEGLYDSVEGQIEAVSILPSGAPAPDATFGSASIAEGEYDLDRVISDNGSRIFWTDLNTEATPENPTGSTKLFVREDDASVDAATVQIDASTLPGTEKEKDEKGGGGVFQTASTEGSRVIFTDEIRLTGNSNSAVGAPDLYAYELNGETGKLGILTDLTAETKTPGEHANVVGVLGASQDGTYVYFAAAGALANGTLPQECLRENETEILDHVEGRGALTKCNVYVAHEGEATKLVATLAQVDGRGGLYEPTVYEYGRGGEYFGDWAPTLAFRTAHVTPDGRQLVFESIEDLTNFHAGGGREIYMYNFDSGVSCVSCNPGGSPTEHERVFYYAHAELPPSINATYELRDVSADGNRVFFVSNEALVSHDTNEEASLPLLGTKGLTNVYEWEREGSAESCPATHTRSSGGCVFLLSDGTSSDISFLLDSSETGQDVFIGTRAQLVTQDHGETFEVYDAHECTMVASCPHEISTACTATGCQGVPPSPPVFATPPSVTFAGVGNFPPPSAPKPETVIQIRAKDLAKALKACKKDKVKKKRATCEKSARKKYGATKAKTQTKARAKKTSIDRRANR